MNDLTRFGSECLLPYESRRATTFLSPTCQTHLTSQTDRVAVRLLVRSVHDYDWLAETTLQVAEDPTIPDL